MPLLHAHSHSRSASKLAVVHDSVIDGAQVTIVIDAGGTLVCLDRERDPEREVDDYRPLCTGCLLERQPGIGRGLQPCSASRKGAARRGSPAGMSYRTPAQKERTRRPKAERKRRQDLIAAHVALYGWVCPGYGRPWHASQDLTADHVVPVARGGSEEGTIRVLCRSCNSRRGAGGTPPLEGNGLGQPRPAFREIHSRWGSMPRFSRKKLSLGPRREEDPSVANWRYPPPLRRRGCMRPLRPVTTSTRVLARPPR
jgi:HNH endonuclease